MRFTSKAPWGSILFTMTFPNRLSPLKGGTRKVIFFRSYRVWIVGLLRIQLIWVLTRWVTKHLTNVLTAFMASGVMGRLKSSIPVIRGFVSAKDRRPVLLK